MIHNDMIQEPRTHGFTGGFKFCGQCPHNLRIGAIEGKVVVELSATSPVPHRPKELCP